MTRRGWSRMAGMKTLTALLDRLPFGPVLVIAVMLAAAPLTPEPHLVEKLRMLAQGTLSRPLDIFDLFLHGTPLLILAAKAGRMIQARRKT